MSMQTTKEDREWADWFMSNAGLFGHVPFVKSVFGRKPSSWGTLNVQSDNGQYYVFPDTYGEDGLTNAIRSRDFTRFGNEEEANGFIKGLTSYSKGYA